MHTHLYIHISIHMCIYLYVYIGGTRGKISTALTLKCHHSGRRGPADEVAAAHLQGEPAAAQIVDLRKGPRKSMYVWCIFIMNICICICIYTYRYVRYTYICMVLAIRPEERRIHPKQML